jgi:acetyl-CoA carboxylase biotin carboxyl carrier protein
LDFEDIERILELVKQHDLAEFELEREGLKLRVRKNSVAYSPSATSVPAAQHAASMPPSQPVLPANAPLALEATNGEEEMALELAVVKSPIVGTFFRSAEPGVPPFVEIGDRVKKDQVLCIIEAMKLMNEITSEYDGEVVNVYVENGNPVQYGERLFAIKTN